MTVRKRTQQSLVTVTTPVPDDIPLIVTGAAGQTESLLRVGATGQGVALLDVYPDGTVARGYLNVQGTADGRTVKLARYTAAGDYIPGAIHLLTSDALLVAFDGNDTPCLRLDYDGTLHVRAIVEDL